MSIEEFYSLMDDVVAGYGDEVVHKVEVGKTLSGQSISAYALFRYNGPTELSESEYKIELARRESILLTGVHHARELTSISQIVFEILALLYRYEAADSQTLMLLDRAAIICIPVFNVDGVSLISEIYR